MNILIVYAHPEPKSFNGAMKDVAVETLRSAGHEVVVSDLYTMRFNPVVGPEDFSNERADPEFFSVQKEQTKAYETGIALGYPQRLYVRRWPARSLAHRRGIPIGGVQ